ncbi:zinc finger CW-type PWWP domain protein 2 [Elysia marginata]|uniref:Zinc finger CW-type PWWP domain protein 2 n=1 Tax=Elysia marginata TaxID=1093978 RepID=A0AAV4I2Y2_9GAST|nr:zinc finger CW-type PWWP domain protein 2 [Elysia marginata]
MSSFAWVQCDNIKCLKWRKISSKVAEHLADKTWTCSMNDDPNFQSCSVDEEDTALFDRLAKKAKLDLIKSEIKKGSLVWAKMDGYCRWPALITNDPACDTHADGDGEEILWYHVEFLGNERSHGWVRTQRVEMFGPNVDNPDSKEATSPKAKNNKRGRKKARHNVTVGKKGKLKKTYKGGSTIQKAISEALTLLPLQFDERIKTCWFVSEDTGLRDSVALSERHKRKKKDANAFSSFPKKRKQVVEKVKSVQSKFDGIPTSDDQVTRKSKRKREKAVAETYENENSHPDRQKQRIKIASELDNIDDDKESRSSLYEIPSPSGLKCLNFPSSLIDTSKEERFMLDVQMYKRNEKAFEEDVKSFMTRQGLNLSAPPVWHNVRVNIFSIFLAVYERGGYDLVCENHQWGVVYAEVTHQQTKNGSGAVKKFYTRNIYAYELFVTGQDYKLAVRALQQAPIGKQMQTTSEDSKVSNSLSSIQIKPEDPEDSGSEVSGYLESLDEILQVLGQEKKDLAQQVPHLHEMTGLNYLQELDLLEGLAGTASISGRALEPEESAQMVPELDFPSSVESSDEGRSLQGFHEMQALQLNVGELDDQINNL